MKRTKRTNANTFDYNDLMIFVALVGGLDPDTYTKHATKALIEKCKAIMEKTQESPSRSTTIYFEDW